MAQIDTIRTELTMDQVRPILRRAFEAETGSPLDLRTEAFLMAMVAQGNLEGYGIFNHAWWTETLDDPNTELDWFAYQEHPEMQIRAFPTHEAGARRFINQLTTHPDLADVYAAASRADVPAFIAALEQASGGARGWQDRYIELIERYTRENLRGAHRAGERAEAGAAIVFGLILLVGVLLLLRKGSRG